MRKQQTQRQILLLRKELETTVQVKNHRISQLEHILSQLQLKQKLHKEQLSSKDAQIAELRQRVSDAEAFSRQRSQVAIERSVVINHLEGEIERLNEMQADKLNDKIKALEEVVAAQEQEMAGYLEDHQAYLEFIDRLQTPWQQTQAERALLSQYNAQLQSQVMEAQKTGTQLEAWVEEAQAELHHHNQQANDLVGQMQLLSTALPS